MEQRPLTILLAEDDPDDADLIRAALEKTALFHALQHVRDGDAAISYLAGAGEYSNREVFPCPQVVLLDLKMPRKNGFEVLQWIRSNKSFSQLPVIVLTSSDEPKDIQRAYQLGATSYLTKAASFKNVVEVLATLAPAWR